METRCSYVVSARGSLLSPNHLLGVLGLDLLYFGTHHAVPSVGPLGVCLYLAKDEELMQAAEVNCPCYNLHTS